jgi:hypothetical protein
LLYCQSSISTISYIVTLQLYLSYSTDVAALIHIVCPLLSNESRMHFSLHLRFSWTVYVWWDNVAIASSLWTCVFSWYKFSEIGLKTSSGFVTTWCFPIEIHSIEHIVPSFLSTFRMMRINDTHTFMFISRVSILVLVEIKLYWSNEVARSSWLFSRIHTSILSSSCWSDMIHERIAINYTYNIELTNNI